LPVLEILEEGAGPVLVLALRGGREGGIDPAQVAARARETVRRHGRLRLLVAVERIGLLEAASLRGHLSTVAGLAGDVERVAIVGDQGWLRGVVRSAPVGRAEVRLFPTARLSEARSWIGLDG
jgi:hypothetical protein